ncbi:MAG TPA: cytochrome P450 [Phenylobacterium sp.]|uniref:cytochrome P450 n=1 Tax=Phenylobacterium sp. TaxID=1871053 RepID=UPI002BD6FDD4|nr:cytochrome P450 [Phenylobacterium sp.]HSV02754.1 cytochrome P450 [Phenylobacterium sp.]
MADDAATFDAARAEAYSTPIDKIDVSRQDRFVSNTIWPFFERLRREDPVHYCAESEFGPYWSITRFDDIVAVETNHQAFSSEKAIGIFDPVPGDDFQMPMFIAMDPPKHDEQRKVIQPIVSSENLANFAPLIRQRAAKILDELPIGEPFDWVNRVSVELTTQMLATLFDFPFEERRKLTYWSDLATTDTDDPETYSQAIREMFPGGAMTVDQGRAELMACAFYFKTLWDQRANAPPANDLISLLAHGEATRDMPLMEFLGNILLLIVGGNDTTRNSITGGLIAFTENPDQLARLRANPALLDSAIPEIIRWQTPVAHMRRTAKADVQLGGKTIKAGDKVVMWYVSGNRDETAIDNPEAFIVDRERPRHHVSFGFGIHRCVGMRLAEMQLKIVWEEILKRFPVIEIVEEPVRVKSCFLRAYRKLMVRIPARA